MNDTRKILIVGPAWIGDMVMAQSLFMFLRQRQPHSVLDVLAPAWSNPLLTRMPQIHKALALSIAHGKLGIRQRYDMARRLRAEAYDQAIVLPNSFKSALIPFWAKIPVRTGWLGEIRYGLLNDYRALDKKKLSLMIQRFIALGLDKGADLPNELPRPRLQADKLGLAQALTKFALNPEEKPVLALCPGAEFGPAKRWPEKHYAQVALYKLREGWQVWLFGSRNDTAVSREINALTQNQCQDLTGKTSLAEAIDLLSLADAVVSNDSGLMHIAAALNRPLIAVYGSSSPDFTPPLNEQRVILRLGLTCSPCFKRQCPYKHLSCLNDLMPKQVLEALAQIKVSEV